MKKKIIIGSILLVLLLSLTGCKSKDAIKFKEDYESLNNKTTSNGENTYRSISIDENNPIIYSSMDEIVEKIDKKETFIVYFGFSACPWCRSVVPYLIEEAKNNNIDKIYYVNVRSDNTKESDIRGYKSLDSDNNIQVDVKAIDSYYEVLTSLDPFLTDYTLETSDGQKMQTGEKRLYAPTVVVYVEGVAKKLTEGISEKQTDAYMDLTEEMINDTKSQFKEIFDIYKDAK